MIKNIKIIGLTGLMAFVGLVSPFAAYAAAADEVVFTPVEEKKETIKLRGQDKEVHVSQYHYGYQGLPQWMEDAQSAGISKQYDFFAIFDGHIVDPEQRIGYRAAQYCAANFYKFLAQALNRGALPQDALAQALRNINDAYLQDTTYNDGTTAAVALINKQDSLIYLANIADARAVVYSNRGVELATADHSLTDQREQDRIRVAGGAIAQGYKLEGEEVVPTFSVYNPKKPKQSLGVSRSIGDRMFKDVGVIAEPTIQGPLNIPMPGFLIVACDGVWDVMSNQEAGNIVQQALNAGRSEQQAAEALVNAASQKNSSDNISVTVVKLDKYAMPAGRAVAPTRRPTPAAQEEDWKVGLDEAALRRIEEESTRLEQERLERLRLQEEARVAAAEQGRASAMERFKNSMQGINLPRQNDPSIR